MLQSPVSEVHRSAFPGRRQGAAKAQQEPFPEKSKDQEKQRVLGIVPNFYVSYVPKAISLSSKQKFELAWKSSVDPFARRSSLQRTPEPWQFNEKQRNAF
jgi:hypothetical protein